MSDTESPSTLPRAQRKGAPLGPRWSDCAGVADWTLAKLGVAKPVVLISGFWRSGTTWLQECLAESLCAKTVFEPLSPEIRARDGMLLAAGIADKTARQALIPTTVPDDDPLWPYLDEAFRATAGSRFSRTCRKSIAESLRRLVVVKDVRLQFNLAGVHRRYGIPVIHVRRHPAAVVASLRKTQWGWSFADVKLTAILPEFAAELEPFDNDSLSRIAAYWALTERFVDRTTQAAWATIVSYEAAIEDPDSTIAHLCAFIGCEQQFMPSFDEQSASNFNLTALSTAHARNIGWRESLTPQDIARIRTIVDTLYPAFPFD